MKRGEIYLAELNPTVGSESNKCHPCLIVSNDANNRAASTVTVLPITSLTTKVFPFEVALAPKESGLLKVSKAQAQQIRTTSKQRIAGPVAGGLDTENMRTVAAAIRLHLGID